MADGGRPCRSAQLFGAPHLIHVSIVCRCVALSVPGGCGIWPSPQTGCWMPRSHSSVESAGFVSLGTMSALPLIVYALRFVYVVAALPSTIVGALVPPWQPVLPHVPEPVLS